MTTLFHAAPIPLAPGSVILPGNWGRILASMGEGHSSWAREQELESVRAEFYPSKPSRLKAAFCCPSEEGLRVYQRTRGGRHDLLYEVELVDACAPRHLADWGGVEPLRGSVVSLSDNAHRYWRAEVWHPFTDLPNHRCEEVVTTSPLRIVRALD